MHFSLESPFLFTGASLKKLTTTIACFYKELTTWLPGNFIEEFDLKENFSIVIQSLMSDVLASHIMPQMEAIAKVCLKTDTDATETLDAHFPRMLAIIDKWFLKEIQST